MKSLTATIVDDEEYARDIIRLLLKNDPEIALIGECENGQEAIDFINENHPDIVFLDIQMPEIDGFEVIKQIDKHQIPQFIFITAFDEYALKAFEVNAVDYLLKPYDDDRFKAALDKAKQQVNQKSLTEMNDRLSSMLTHIEQGGSNKTIAISKIPVKTGHRIHFVDVYTVDWIEAADQYVKLHVGDKYHLIRESMNALEQKLSTRNFLRIHRSTIINVERVNELQPYSKGDYVVILKSGVTLKMSRTRKEKLQEMLGW